MRIHVFIASLVISASVLLGLGRLEFLMVNLAILGVLSAEILNTLAELLVDLVEPKYNIFAKAIKDIAAAGVLLTAFFSVIIGIIAFYPSITNLEQVLGDFHLRRWPLLLINTGVFVLPSLWGMIKWGQA